VDQDSPTTWKLGVDVPRASAIHVRLTDLPGWYATVDGRAASIDSWHQVMMAIDIPPGRHLVVLHYAPRSFDVGLVVAVATALALCAALIIGFMRRRTGVPGAPAPPPTE